MLINTAIRSLPRALTWSRSAREQVNLLADAPCTATSVAFAAALSRPSSSSGASILDGKMSCPSVNVTVIRLCPSDSSSCALSNRRRFLTGVVDIVVSIRQIQFRRHSHQYKASSFRDAISAFLKLESPSQQSQQLINPFF